MALPASCDVLVIGAGPAGAAAAALLASSGHDVLLVDQRAFPRDKVCGDLLVSDALGALMLLGLDEPVLADAWEGQELRVYAPSGAHVAVRGRFAVVPRERLDDVLLHGAADAGAAIVEPMTAVAPLLDGDRVAGARFRSTSGEHGIQARFTVLATGATATVSDAFGLSSASPQATAGRAYYAVPDDVAARVRHLTIAYQRAWCPGHGWMVPGPGNVFNVGVMLPGVRADERLPQFWNEFITRFTPVASVLAAARLVSPFRTAPLRSGLIAGAVGRPGLLAVGEAIGTTYPATGAGIGKALDSGLLAAVMISEALTGTRSLETVAEDYRRELDRRFGTRYRAYGVAERWASYPWLIDRLVRRAAPGSFLRQELEQLVAESGDAGSLFSLRGLLKSLVR